MTAMLESEGRIRVVIEGVSPEIDSGAFPVKRIAGDLVVVEADIFTDGHDLVAAELLYRFVTDAEWRRVPMTLLGNDRWRGEFLAESIGKYQYTVEGWISRFATWRGEMEKRLASAQDVRTDWLIGAGLILEAAASASPDDAYKLQQYARMLSDDPGPAAAKLDEIAAVVERYPDRRFAARYQKELSVVVDREKARFSTWYEMFPRSCSTEPGRHGTLRDSEARLPYVAAMGFDVLYLPPIHPIGLTARKGKNNSEVAGPDDVGSPWAIGSDEGGHTSVEPKLGTLADFDRLVAKAKDHGIEIALDLAFQCSPDHPYVREHPEWFRKRLDGTIQYAENPPKKYQDIVPFDFETPQWRTLWQELKNVRLVLDRPRCAYFPRRQPAYQSP